MVKYGKHSTATTLHQHQPQCSKTNVKKIAFENNSQLLEVFWLWCRCFKRTLLSLWCIRRKVLVNCFISWLLSSFLFSVHCHSRSAWYICIVSLSDKAFSRCIINQPYAIRIHKHSGHGFSNTWFGSEFLLRDNFYFTDFIFLCPKDESVLHFQSPNWHGSFLHCHYQ